MAKAPGKPGKGYLNVNKNKQGMQPDFKGYITLARSYNEGDVINFGAWNNDFGGFNLTESKPQGGDKQYPKPVVEDDPHGVPF